MAASERWLTCDVHDLRQAAALILNPHAGQKLGDATNSNGREKVVATLRAEGIPFDL